VDEKVDDEREAGKETSTQQRMQLEWTAHALSAEAQRLARLAELIRSSVSAANERNGVIPEELVQAAQDARARLAVNPRAVAMQHVYDFAARIANGEFRHNGLADSPALVIAGMQATAMCTGCINGSLMAPVPEFLHAAKCAAADTPGKQSSKYTAFLRLFAALRIEGCSASDERDETKIQSLEKQHRRWRKDGTLSIPSALRLDGS